MLHPRQFTVNEAWIVFRLNSAPIRTESDEDFDCLALMDAASCFILGSEFIACSAHEPAELEIRRLLKQGWQHKEQMPGRLLVPPEYACGAVTRVARQEDIVVEIYPALELSVFIKDAVEGFEKHFAQGRA